MSPNRRYDEQEIKAIFKQAAESQDEAQGHLARQEGLTLSELQEIGKEVGITPAFIARAASALDSPTAQVPTQTLLGLPISVSRSVDLPRALTNSEWDRLVADLRETFQAKGEARRDGSLRQWANGNLQINVEPTANGHRLRMYTRKGNVQNNLWGGLFIIVFGLIMMLSVTLKKGLEPAVLIMMSSFIVGGLGLMGSSTFGLPRWAKKRGTQMDAIARRTLNMIGSAKASAAPVASRISLDTHQEADSEKPVRPRHRLRS